MTLVDVGLARCGKRGRVALAAAAMLAGILGQAPASSSAQAATEQEKEQIGLLYGLQMAPAYCKWADVGDSAKLDEKVAEAEKLLGITEADKAKYKKLAEEDLKKPSVCTDGFARSLYDEAIK